MKRVCDDHEEEQVIKKPRLDGPCGPLDDSYLPDEMWGEVAEWFYMRSQLLVFARLSTRFLRIVTPLKGIDTISLPWDTLFWEPSYRDGLMDEWKLRLQSNVQAKLARLFRPHTLVNVGILFYSYSEFYYCLFGFVIAWIHNYQTRVRHLSIHDLWTDSADGPAITLVATRLSSLSVSIKGRLDDLMRRIGISSKPFPNIHTFEVSKAWGNQLFLTDCDWIVKHLPNLQCLTLRNMSVPGYLHLALPRLQELNVMFNDYAQLIPCYTDQIFALLTRLPPALVTLRVRVDVQQTLSTVRYLLDQCAKVITEKPTHLCLVELMISHSLRLDMLRTTNADEFQVSVVKVVPKTL